MRCLAWLAVALLVPGAGAQYLQLGYEAGKTGDLPFDGPAWPDVAWRLDLPGSRAVASVPLLVERQAYVVTADLSRGDDEYARHGLAAFGVWRIDIDRPQDGAQLVIPLPAPPPMRGFPGTITAGLRPPPTMASDGHELLVVHGSRIDAFPLAGGGPRLLWEISLPGTPARPAGDLPANVCVDPAVHGRTLLVTCTSIGAGVGGPGAASSDDLRVFAAAIDIDAGQLVWLWQRPTTLATERALPPPVDALPGDPAGLARRAIAAGMETQCAENSVCRPMSLHVAASIGVYGPVVGVTTLAAWHGDEGRPPGSGRFLPDPVLVSFEFLDLQSGRWLWRDALPNPELGLGRPFTVSCKGTWDGHAFFYKLDGLHKVDPRTGESLWGGPKPMETTTRTPLENCSSFALRDGQLFTSSMGDLYRWSTAGPDPEVRHGLEDQRQQIWSLSLFHVDRHRVYGRAVGNELAVAVPVDNWLRAHHADTLEPAWEFGFRHPFATDFPRAYDYAMGPDVIIVAGLDGTVTALGRTVASLAVTAGAPVRQPALGEEVEVQLLATDGALGPAIAYRADWGDGASSDWQASARFRHVYREAPPDGHVARFEARNDAGQTASTPVLMQIGGAPGGASGLGSVLVAAVVASLAAGGAMTGLRRRGRRVPDRFVVERELARGAFGVARLAHDRILGRDVVLKEPRLTWAIGPMERRRWLREARVAARIDHPNVLKVLDVLDRDPPAIVLAYAPGGSLQDRIMGHPAGRDGALAVSDAVAIMDGVLRGLEAIHTAGIVHGDLKPANILFADDGRPLVTDFGIASPTAPDGEATQQFGVGSPDYMAPEQKEGQATQASDIFAAGRTLARLLAVTATRGRGLHDVVARATASDPAKRYRDASEMRSALARGIA